MKRWTASVVAILLASFPGVASAQANCEAIPPVRRARIATLPSVNSIVDDRILPLPERGRNQTPPGIGQFRNRPSETQTTSATIKAQIFPRGSPVTRINEQGRDVTDTRTTGGKIAT